jgi:hypothetical protein
MERIETQGSEVVADKRKIRSHTRLIESKHIPVIHNRYEVHNNCYIGEYENSHSVGSHPFVRNSKIKTNKSTKAKH